MATITVCAGGMCDATTVQGGIDAASAGDTVSIANGTYTENLDVDKELTLQATTGNAADVIITSSGNGATIRINDDGAADTIIIQDLTIKYTGTSTSNLLSGAVMPTSHNTEKVTVRRCVIESHSVGIGWHGAGTIIDRCKMTGTADNNYNYGILMARLGHISACLLVDWRRAGMQVTDASALGTTIKNCTVITTAGATKNTLAGIWLIGANDSSTVGPLLYNSIVYNGAGGGMGYGIRINDNDDVCDIKNNLVFDEDGTGTGTMQTKEIYRTSDSDSAGRVLANYVTDHSSGDTDGQATVDSGNAVFTDFDNADYRPNADGSAAGNGLHASVASTDLNGNSYANPPAIGCYATPSSGYSACTHVSGVAIGNLASVNGVAKANIASVDGVS
jgi:hypothetical protein